MKEAQSKEINGKNVVVQPWPARKAWTRQITLGNIFGSSLQELGEAIGDGGLDSNIDLGKLGGAIGTLLSNISEDQADKILSICITGVRINNKEVTLDTMDVIIDDVADIYQIIGFVLEVNYSGFLDRLGIGKHRKEL